MNCPGFRAPSSPSWELDISALVSLKQTNKKVMSPDFGCEGKKAILYSLSFESTLIQEG